MEKPLMPKATALWLMRHTKLTIDQISHFCGFHPLQTRALLESERGTLQEVSPLSTGQLSAEEIERCEKDPHAQLTLISVGSEVAVRKRKYTPLSKRSDVPNAVLFLVRQYPKLSDMHICRLLCTTKTTVQGIRDGTRRDSKELTPKDPVLLGLCTTEELENFLKKIE